MSESSPPDFEASRARHTAGDLKGEAQSEVVQP
jgi:hypothetical protein